MHVPLHLALVDPEVRQPVRLGDPPAQLGALVEQTLHVLGRRLGAGAPRAPARRGRRSPASAGRRGGRAPPSRPRPATMWMRSGSGHRVGLDVDVGQQPARGRRTRPGSRRRACGARSSGRRRRPPATASRGAPAARPLQLAGHARRRGREAGQARCAAPPARPAARGRPAGCARCRSGGRRGRRARAGRPRLGDGDLLDPLARGRSGPASSSPCAGGEVLVGDLGVERLQRAPPDDQRLGEVRGPVGARRRSAPGRRAGRSSAPR